MRRAFRYALLGAFGLALGAATYLLVRIGPANVWSMARYYQRSAGTLRVGDAAPDVSLVALDGVARVRLHERLRGKPLVLVFGSFT